MEKLKKQWNEIWSQLSFKTGLIICGLICCIIFYYQSNTEMLTDRKKAVFSLHLSSKNLEIEEECNKLGLKPQGNKEMYLGCVKNNNGVCNIVSTNDWEIFNDYVENCLKK